MADNGEGLGYEFGCFRLEAGERRLYRDGEPVPLGAKSLDLLLILVESAGRLKTREELIEALWPTSIVGEHNLTVNLSAVRKALGEAKGSRRYIQTVSRRGYRFVATVVPVAIRPERSVVPDLRPAASTIVRKRWRMAGVTALVVLGALIVGIYFGYPGLRARLTGSAAPIPSIAVLPFQNLSPRAANDEWLVRGIRETIYTKLAGIRELRVVPHGSTDPYPSHPTDLKKVAGQLGASAVLEGSVQKAGKWVQINLLLIDAGAGRTVWSETYTRSLSDLFALQGDVAARVAAALETKLLPVEAERLAHVPTTDPQAYGLLLRANDLANQVFLTQTAGDPVAILKEAVALYRRAIARDPRFALAYARLSLLQSRAYWFGVDSTPQGIAEAERAAKRALALDPDLPQAHMAMGYVAYYGKEDFTAALAQFEQAGRSLKNNANVTGAIAFVLRRQGKWREALAGLHKAAFLDPRNPLWPAEAGATYMSLRHYRQALSEFNLALAIEPYDYDVVVSRIWALFLAGELAQARQALAQIPGNADPQGMVSGARFEAARLAGQPDQALHALNQAPLWVLGSALPGSVPRSLLEAEARALKGDVVRAHEAYDDALTKLQVALRQQPENPDLWSALGLAEAGLGQKEAAIRDGGRATTLFPVTKDLMDGPTYLAALAQIYAVLGEADPAVKLLDRLLGMPAGRAVSVPLLKLDPVWDPVRSDPRFQALLKRYENRPPSPSTVRVSFAASG